MPTTIITIFAEKGGTGKTTLTFNLAGFLANQGSRVLAVDCDKQGNLSKSFLKETGVLELHPHNTIAGIFDETTPAMPDQLVYPTGIDNIFLIPANRSLKQFIMPGEEDCTHLQWRLAEFLQDVGESGNIDFILIDTSPDIDGLPAWAALLASHFVLTPLEPSSYSAQSCNGVTLQIQAAQKLNPALCFLGFVLNLKLPRRKDHEEWESATRTKAGELVFKTVLGNLAPFARATDAHMPVLLHDPKSKAANLIKALAKEIMARIDPPKPKQPKTKTSRRERKAA